MHLVVYIEENNIFTYIACVYSKPGLELDYTKI